MASPMLDDLDRPLIDLLADGEVVESGPPRTVLDAPRHAATRALLTSRQG